MFRRAQYYFRAPRVIYSTYQNVRALYCICCSEILLRFGKIAVVLKDSAEYAQSLCIALYVFVSCSFFPDQAVSRPDFLFKYPYFFKGSCRATFLSPQYLWVQNNAMKEPKNNIHLDFELSVGDMSIPAGSLKVIIYFVFLICLASCTWRGIRRYTTYNNALWQFSILWNTIDQSINKVSYGMLLLLLHLGSSSSSFIFTHLMFTREK